MPYIKPFYRKAVDKQVCELTKLIKKHFSENDIDGVVNYMFCKILLKVLGDKPSYLRYERILGALECIKQELYRRVITPYEEEKKKENGDIL